MQALELLWLAKRHVSGRMTLNSEEEEIKAVAIAVIELHLSEGISKGVSRKFNLIENFKIPIFGNDLKTFLSLANLYCLNVTK